MSPSLFASPPLGDAALKAGHTRDLRKSASDDRLRDHPAYDCADNSDVPLPPIRMRSRRGIRAVDARGHLGWGAVDVAVREPTSRLALFLLLRHALPASGVAPDPRRLSAAVDRTRGVERRQPRRQEQQQQQQ